MSPRVFRARLDLERASRQTLAAAPRTTTPCRHPMETFSTLTEFAVAIAGFAGITIAIHSRSGALGPIARFRNQPAVVRAGRGLRLDLPARGASSRRRGLLDLVGVERPVDRALRGADGDPRPRTDELAGGRPGAVPRRYLEVRSRRKPGFRDASGRECRRLEILEQIIVEPNRDPLLRAIRGSAAQSSSSAGCLSTRRRKR